MVDSRDSEQVKVGPSVKVLSGWRRWLPFYVYRSQRGWSVRVFPIPCVLWLVTLLLLGYLSAGTALYLNDRYRRNLTEISLWDRLYPPRWEHYRTARGNSLIENGRQALERGELANAAHLLRSGLTRSPANVEGRELLADIYLFAKRSDLAEGVLLAGLEPDSFDPANDAFLRRTISFLFQRQRDQAIIDLTAQLTDRHTLADPTQRYLAFARSNAFFFRGNFDQAEATLRDFGLQGAPEGRILSARIEWDRGFRDLALTLIEQLAHEFPENADIYRLQTQWLAESGQTDRARRLSLLRRIDRPDELRPRLDLLVALDEAGDNPAVAAESQALLAYFPDQPEACLLLGDFAANAGRPAIADQAFHAAETRKFPTSGLALMRVEARIVAGQYREAVELSHELLDANPDWESSLAPVFNGLQAIAHFAMGDRESADLYLNDFLNQRNLRAENLVAVSNRLISVGADQQAHHVLQQAVRLDPLNQPALTSLVEFELKSPETTSLGDHLADLLNMRRPSPQLLRQAYDTLGRDRFIFMDDRESLIDRIARALAGNTATPSA